jgi:hypothetical protein
MKIKVSRYQPGTFFIDETQGGVPIKVEKDRIGCYSMKPRTYFIWLSRRDLKYGPTITKFK